MKKTTAEWRPNVPVRKDINDTKMHLKKIPIFWRKFDVNAFVANWKYIIKSSYLMELSKHDILQLEASSPPHTVMPQL